MAVIRNYIRCKVCEHVTLLRVQYGWLVKHPIRYYCGNCSISIYGTVWFKQDGRIEINFDNAIRVEQCNPQYYIEASGELLTEKLAIYNPDLDFVPPFFKSSFFTMQERVPVFQNRVQMFLNYIDLDVDCVWSTVKRINELWFNNDERYIKKEIREVLPILVPEFSLTLSNTFEIQRAIHSINLSFLAPIIYDRFKKKRDRLRKMLSKLQETQNENLGELVDHFSDELLNYERKIFECIEKFTVSFQYLIPAFSLLFYKRDIRKDMKTKGISTASFEDLKSFYVDLFEFSLDLSDLLVAYNNLYARNDFAKMVDNSYFRDIKTLGNIASSLMAIKRNS